MFARTLTRTAVSRLAQQPRRGMAYMVDAHHRITPRAAGSQQVSQFSTLGANPWYTVGVSGFFFAVFMACQDSKLSQVAAEDKEAFHIFNTHCVNEENKKAMTEFVTRQFNKKQLE